MVLCSDTIDVNDAKDYRIPKMCHSYSFEWGTMQHFIWPLNRRKPRFLNQSDACSELCMRTGGPSLRNKLFYAI